MGSLFSALVSPNELKKLELEWHSKKNPHSVDSDLYNAALELLDEFGRIQQSIEDYKGAKEAIKVAMSAKQGTEEGLAQIRAAMEAVIPNAAICQHWMEFAQSVATFLREKMFPQLSLRIIAAPKDDNDDNDNDGDTDNVAIESDEKEPEVIVSETTVMAHQALSFQTCQIMESMLTFDQLKMLNSDIQNDFAYYKRAIVNRRDAHLKDLDFPVSGENGGFLSMFLAVPIPLMSEVSSQLRADPKAVSVVAVICNACVDLLRCEDKFVDNPDAHRLVLRAMVASFCIYDHASESGAFHRRSPIKTSKVVSMVTNDYLAKYGNKDNVAGLDSVLRYATAHYNDDSTPQSVKRSLEAQ